LLHGTEECSKYKTVQYCSAATFENYSYHCQVRTLETNMESLMGGYY